VLQALLTPAIAATVALIAFFQWRTAHQKLVIDLFERRMKIYTQCKGLLRKILANPAQGANETAFEFQNAVAEAEWLFGDDMRTLLDRAETAIFDLAIREAELNGATQAEQRKPIVEKRRIALDLIRTVYHTELKRLAKPYLQLAQRSSLAIFTLPREGSRSSALIG
jgi:hypothetical protein